MQVDLIHSLEGNLCKSNHSPLETWLKFPDERCWLSSIITERKMIWKLSATHVPRSYGEC